MTRTWVRINTPSSLLLLKCDLEPMSEMETTMKGCFVCLCACVIFSRRPLCACHVKFVRRLRTSQSFLWGGSHSHSVDNFLVLRFCMPRSEELFHHPSSLNGEVICRGFGTARTRKRLYVLKKIGWSWLSSIRFTHTHRLLGISRNTREGQWSHPALVSLTH